MGTRDPPLLCCLFLPRLCSHPQAEPHGAHGTQPTSLLWLHAWGGTSPPRQWEGPQGGPAWWTGGPGRKGEVTPGAEQEQPSIPGPSGSPCLGTRPLQWAWGAAPPPPHFHFLAAWLGQLGGPLALEPGGAGCGCGGHRPHGVTQSSLPCLGAGGHSEFPAGSGLPAESGPQAGPRQSPPPSLGWTAGAPGWSGLAWGH